MLRRRRAVAAAAAAAESNGEVSRPVPAAELLPAALPAATAEDLLEAVRRSLDAESVAVRRTRWPQWLVCGGGRPFAVDGREGAAEELAAAVPGEQRTHGPLTVVGGLEGEPAALELLGLQAAAMDAAALDTRLASMAELAAGAGHEVNNPLATIAGRAAALAKGEADPERKASLDAILAQAFRGRDMIGDLMLFARPPEPHPERVSVAEAVAEALAEFRGDFEARGLRVAGDRDPDAVAWADRTQLAVVVSELLRNALRFAAGEVVVDVTPAGEDVRLRVRDDGPGVEGEARRHLFDPFYSGRQAGRGLGFGLPKCWRIVTGHGGAVRLRDAATFEVLWPAPR